MCRLLSCFVAPLFVLSVSGATVASEPDDHKAKLSGIARELLLIERLTFSAESEQPQDATITFDYPGLRRDLNLIRTGIEEYIHVPTLSPRPQPPVTGSYR